MELIDSEGRLETSPAPTPMHLESHDGELVAVPELPLPVLTDDHVRETLEAQRR